MLRAARLFVVLLVGLLGLVYAMGSGWLGSHWGAGRVTPQAIPESVVAERRISQQRAAAAAGVSQAKQILFGDLYVHSDLCEGRGAPGDDCLAETEERAWSSPIFVSYAKP